MLDLNSFDEWSPLKEIIVGSALNYTSHERELSFELFFHHNLKGRESYYYPRLNATTDANSTATRMPIKQRYVDELNEDVAGLVATLESLGVMVHRPMDIDKGTAVVQTPAWSASVLPPLNLRDIAVVLGDEIIETPPMIRARYFETQFLKPVFTQYARRNARWTVMPRPFMTDNSFDLSYMQSNFSPPTEQVRDPKPSPYDVGYEMLFDGAQILRLGNDLVVNVSTENHAMACDWLERHLEDRFRIHRIYRVSDSHIDTMLLALRPGLLLARSQAVIDALPPALQKWDIVIPPPPEINNFPAYDDDDVVLTSPFIDLNVLSVDPETILVNSACPELIQTLEKLHFTVVPVRHRHRRLFGGGFHCFTLDTVREGGPADYLD